MTSKEKKHNRGDMSLWWRRFLPFLGVSHWQGTGHSSEESSLLPCETRVVLEHVGCYYIPIAIAFHKTGRPFLRCMCPREYPDSCFSGKPLQFGPIILALPFVHTFILNGVCCQAAGSSLQRSTGFDLFYYMKASCCQFESWEKLFFVFFIMPFLSWI